MDCIEKLIVLMLSSIPSQRPSCVDILNNEEWSINIKDMRVLELEVFELMKDNSDQFIINYFQQKIISNNLFDKRFKILNFIANGVYGKVYKVQDKYDKKLYAMKIFLFNGK